MDKDTYIEYPSAGQTYHREEYGVYQYDTYPEHSVLAGQTRRTFLDSFEHLDEAKKEYPDAQFIQHSMYQAPILSHLPEEEI